MQAVMATLWGLPASVMRRKSSRMTGLQRTAVSVAMERTVRTPARPPRVCRCPRCVPLSLLKGAKPGEGGDGLA